MILSRRRTPIKPEKAKANLESATMRDLRQMKEKVTKYTQEKLGTSPDVYRPALEPAPEPVIGFVQKRQAAAKCLRVACRRQL